MLELLKRFEEENLEDDIEGDDDSDDGRLESRLQGISIDDVSSEALWDKLTAEERSKFMDAIRNPSSDLAKKLLQTSLESENTVAPWWETFDEDNDIQMKSRTQISPHVSRQSTVHAKRPRLVDFPLPPAREQITSFPLAYNLAAIIIAYVYASRHLSISPLSHSSFASSATDARQIIRDLVPFLTERQSKTRLETLEDAVTSIWSRFEPGSMNSSFFMLLLRDAAALLRPQKVMPIADTGNAKQLDLSPHINILLVLSDLQTLFSASASAVPTPHKNHISAKITYYVAQVASLATGFMEGLCEEVELRADREEAESIE